MDLAKRIAELSPEKRKLLLRQLEGQNSKKEPGLQPILRQNRESNMLPLSFSQQRLWFLDQLEPGNTAYNIPVVIRLTGALDRVALEKSLIEIIQRHESLRTTFSIVNEMPVQVINPPTQLALPVIDLQTFSAEEQGTEVQKLIASEALESFDLVQGPLIRTSLLKLKEEEHIFLVTIHHVVSDAWSVGVFIQELRVLYGAFSGGKPSPLPEMPIQYADFAQWQQELLQGEVLEKQLAYWRKQLAPPLPVLDLPTDHPRPKIQTFNGAQQSSTLSESSSQRLRELSRQEGCTTFMVLLAAFYILLARLTGQSDIIVGSPIAGRNREELESLIGFFINTVVLRANLEGDPSFRELLKHVREVALEAYAHQDIPFEKLLEELQPERDLSRTPIFQVFFNMLNFNADAIDFSGLKGEFISRPEAESKFDLTFYINEQNKQIQLVFVYNTDLFSQERMAEMLSQYSHLLMQIVADPDRKISHFSLITDQAKEILPDPAQALTSSAYQPVHSAFARQAMRVPDNIALIDKSGVWTYRELDTRSNQLASLLCDKGIRPHDVVAIYAHRSASLVWALLGILKAGATFVILDSAYPVQRLINYLQVVKPKGWIQLEDAGPLSSELREFVEASSYRCTIHLSPIKSKVEALLGNYSGEAPEVIVHPDDPAYIAFTSGSTGKPKGILGTHRPISHFMDWHANTFGLNETDRFSMLSGLAHDPLLRDIFTPLWLGATLCIPNQEQMLSPGQLSTWMNEQRISVAHLTPALQQVLAAAGANIQENSVPSLRYAFFGGEALTYSHTAGLKQLAPNVRCVNFYGATETPQAMSYIVPDIPSGPDSDHPTTLKQVVPLGRGIQDVQLLVLNASLELAGVGEVGEIHIRTPYLSQGYVEDETLTQQRFISNPFTQDPADKMYKTGDLGRYLPDGQVQYIGRNDQQVKIRGFRIELSEIESVLTEHPAIRQTVVDVWAPSIDDKRLVAYVVPKEQDFHKASELQDYLRERLPVHMIPSNIIFLPAIPITPNGKINRAALPRPDGNEPGLDLEQINARNNIEEELVRIWQDLLHTRKIGVKDNFFKLGGHSLMAVHMFTRIAKKFNVNLPLATLFQEATIEHLARVIHLRTEPVTWSSLIEIEPAGDHPPFFCIHGITGDILWFRDLAKALAPDYPFYGLQARGLDGIQEPFSQIEAMATYYIGEMRLRQPQGPYFLGGASLGGTVALEIAQQLLQQGEKVALLAIFDHFPRNVTVESSNGKFTKGLINAAKVAKNFPNWFKEFRRLGYQHMLMRLRRTLKIVRKLREQPDVPDAERFDAEDLIDFAPELSAHRHRLITSHYQAMNAYQPGPYRGHVTLFRAKSRPLLNTNDPEVVWQKLAPGNTCVIDIPGSHEGMFKIPQVNYLAEKLRGCIDQALANNPQQSVQ